jgi:hypothetical protein
MKIKKLNSRGFSHGIVLLLFVVIFAISGIGYLVYSKAATSPGPIIYATPRATPSGGYLDQAIMSLDVNTGVKKTLVPAQPGVNYGRLVYSPNNRYVAWLGTGNKIWLYDFSTSSVKSIGALPATSFDDKVLDLHYHFVAWNKDGTKIALAQAVTSGTFDIYTINVDGSALTKIHTNKGQNINSMALTGDGNNVVYTEQYGGVYSVVPGQARVQLHDGQCKYAQAKPYSPTTVSYVCNNYAQTRIFKDTIYEHTLGGTSKELYAAVTTNNSAHILGYAWTYDGSEIATSTVENAGSADSCSPGSPSTLNIATFKVDNPAKVIKVTSSALSDMSCGDNNSPLLTTISWGIDSSTLVYQSNPQYVSNGSSSLYKVRAATASTPTNLLPLGSLNDYTWNGGADLPIPTTTTPTPKPPTTTPKPDKTIPKVSLKFEDYRVKGVSKGATITAKGKDASGISKITIYDSNDQPADPSFIPKKYKKLKTCYQVTTCKVDYALGSSKRGWFRIYVSVEDKAGNYADIQKDFTWSKSGGFKNGRQPY